LSACKLHSTEEAVLDIPPFQHGRGCSGGGSTQERTMRRCWLVDRPGSVGDWASRVRVVALSLEGWNGRARRLKSAQFAARTYILEGHTDVL
jgi:hypothetical protein